MAMDAMESDVRKVMEVARVTMISVPISPTFPTTQPKRKYMITPKTVSMDGVNTPPKVFSCPPLCVFSFLITKFFTVFGNVNIVIKSCQA